MGDWLEGLLDLRERLHEAEFDRQEDTWLRVRKLLDAMGCEDDLMAMRVEDLRYKIVTLIDDVINREQETDAFCRRLESAAMEREDVTLWDVDYIPAPVDADGKTIRVGDVAETPIEEPFEVREIAMDESGTWLVRDRVGVAYDVRECTSYRKPTVEDVLTDFVLALDSRGHLSNGVATTINEFAPKLQLKEESC